MQRESIGGKQDARGIVTANTIGTQHWKLRDSIRELPVFFNFILIHPDTSNLEDRMCNVGQRHPHLWSSAATTLYFQVPYRRNASMVLLVPGRLEKFWYQVLRVRLRLVNINAHAIIICRTVSASDAVRVNLKMQT